MGEGITYVVDGWLPPSTSGALSSPIHAYFHLLEECNGGSRFGRGVTKCTCILSSLADLEGFIVPHSLRVVHLQ